MTHLELLVVICIVFVVSSIFIGIATVGSPPEDRDCYKSPEECAKEAMESRKRTIERDRQQKEWSERYHKELARLNDLENKNEKETP